VVRYKKILPLILTLAIAVILLVAKFPIFSRAKTPLVDSVSLGLKILNFPFQEIKKLVFYHSNYNRSLLLKSENARLTNQMVELDELRQENDRLKSLFSFKSGSDYSLVVAQVIGKDSSNWSSSVIVDKGRNSGVESGRCVVTDAGLAGKVVEVGNATSKIMLISDPNSSVAALIQRSREQGIVSGTITGQLRLHFLAVDSDIKAGDTVITSGLGGIYPKGLVVGRIIEIGVDKGGLSKSCLVVPTVKLSKLEEVLIMAR